MINREKIVLTWNKFFLSLIKELKKMSPELNSIIKKHYRTFDKASTIYHQEFSNEIKPVFEKIISLSADQLLADSEVLKKSPIKKLSFHETITHLNSNDTKVFQNYILILILYSKILDEFPDNLDTHSEMSDLYQKTTSIITNIGSNRNVDSDIEDILDDDYKNLILKIIATSQDSGDRSKNPEPESQAFNGFENSKIVNLAKEISEEIDISNLKIENNDDLMKMMDFSNSNNMLGDIITKVSNSVSSKLSSGEMKQEDLMNEASQLLQNMGGNGGGLGAMAGLMNNPMLSEMMKQMKKGKTQTRNTGRTDTRDRLRKKLEERNKIR